MSRVTILKPILGYGYEPGAEAEFSDDQAQRLAQTGHVAIEKPKEQATAPGGEKAVQSPKETR